MDAEVLPVETQATRVSLPKDQSVFASEKGQWANDGANGAPPPAGGIPGAIADSAQRSVGTAFGIAAQLDAAGRPTVARQLHEAASNAFFDGFQIAVLVAVAITVVGAVAAAILIPSQPPEVACEPIEISGPQVSPQRP